MYPKVCLRKTEEADIIHGQNRIYDNEIDWYDDTCIDGGIVDVLDSREHFVARGYFNAKSKIVVRILTRNEDQTIDADLILNRIKEAWELRRQLGFENSCRVVFGDSDLLPGLTIDKFGDYFSFQIATLGMEAFKQDIIRALVELFHPQGIMERDDLPVREKEGLSEIKECVYGTVPEEIIIREHDIRVYADLINGQKTGHFLDQQENRGRIRPYVQGKQVLDLCCCSGGFSVHAAVYGAAQVEASDASAHALQLVMRNAELNGCTNITTTEADVFELLRRYRREGKQYDTIILDPPAFAKSRKVLDRAYNGYKELNMQAMQLLKPGGILITFSCSQFMTSTLFEQMLREAASDTKKNVRLLERLIQSRDHAATLTEDQALYLKGNILQVL